MDPVNAIAIIFSVSLLILIIAVPNSVWAGLFRVLIILGSAWVAYWAFIILILEIF